MASQPSASVSVFHFGPAKDPFFEKSCTLTISFSVKVWAVAAEVAVGRVAPKLTPSLPLWPSLQLNSIRHRSLHQCRMTRCWEGAISTTFYFWRRQLSWPSFASTWFATHRLSRLRTLDSPLATVGAPSVRPIVNKWAAVDVCVATATDNGWSSRR